MPAPTLIATLSASNANSYADVAAADAYFANGFDASRWDEIDPDDKARALIVATRELETFHYWGEPASQNQALKWPAVYEWEASADAIPAKILQGLFELALVRAEANASGSKTANRRDRLRAAGVTSLKIDSYSETFTGGGAESFNSAEGKLESLPPVVQRCIADWICTSFVADSGRQAAHSSSGISWPWPFNYG